MTRTAVIGIQAAARVDLETWLRIPGGANNVMTSPDHAQFAVTDFDASWFGTLDDVTVADQAVIGQWSTVGNQRSWNIRIANVAAGLQLRLWTSLNGSTSVSTPDNHAMLPPLTPGVPFGVRASRRASDGWVYMWVTATDPPTWTILNAAGVAVNPGTLLNSTAAVMIGGYGAAAGSAGHAVGYFRRAEIRNGFAGVGSLIATPDVRAVPESATGFTDSTSKVWTVGGTADLVSVVKAA